MFTGIIEQLGIIQNIESKGSNVTLTIKAALVSEIRVDQSISHSGVCLTVETINTDTYSVTAIDETQKKTNVGNWQKGTLVLQSKA